MTIVIIYLGARFSQESSERAYKIKYDSESLAKNAYFKGYYWNMFGVSLSNGARATIGGK